ncbi:MAG: hypothetical protein AAGK04_10565, partial [Planctomycetota bacterium]
AIRRLVDLHERSTDPTLRVESTLHAGVTLQFRGGLARMRNDIRGPMRVFARDGELVLEDLATGAETEVQRIAECVAPDEPCPLEVVRKAGPPKTPGRQRAA